MIQRKVFEESLMNTYRAWHDVYPVDERGCGLPLLARAEFRARNERYVLVKQAKLWAAENYEYSYIFSMERLTAKTAKECVNFALEEGMPKIKPHSEHMCSYITAIFIADEIDDDAIRFIKKCRYSKSFRFSLHGWMSLKVLAKEMNTGKLVSNREGKDLKDLFDKVQVACEKKAGDNAQNSE